jgi:hypothetical protein
MLTLGSSCTRRTDFEDGEEWVPTPPYTFHVKIDESSTGSTSSNNERVVTNDKVHLDRMMAMMDQIRSSKASISATATWRWCNNFVVPHGLCPWAAGSVATEGALQLFLVDQDLMMMINNRKEHPPGSMVVLHEIAERFLRSINVEKTIDPNKAIFFIVFLHENMMNFAAFYDWYVALEDEWDLGDDVTLAPFHPNWTYGDDDDPLCMEKRSPYPLVSLVATRVIDQAGEAATERISATNEQILRLKTANEWETIYNTAIGNRDHLRHTDWQLGRLD